MKIIIIGGGIGGLTTALCLHKAGFKVKVFESVREVKPLGVGINTLPHSVRVLTNLDLQETLAQNAIETTDLVYFNKFGQQISSNNVSDLDLTFNTKDTNDKMYNALRYLISLAKNDVKYQKFDNDPFANKNFQESNNIISTNNKSNKIQLTSDGGVYKIWVEISGIRKSFVLDTGASEISISQNVENELISKNLLQKMDYVEPALYKIADGSIVLCRRVKLKQVKVGNIIVKNVIASIGVSETPLLLGKNFLDNFQKWSIDNKTKILTLEN